MLLEFRIRNFRSIRDEQMFSLVASTSEELSSTHVAQTSVKTLPGILRSAAIYGPNASGKSTFLNALNYLRSVVAESASVLQPGQVYNLMPFKLDAVTAQEPTSFEITFLMDGVRHQYNFAMTQSRIVSESLLVYRSNKPQEWFSRHINDDGESYAYKFSTHLTGPRKIWEESTRSNALFLSTAAQLNSELLSPIFSWITQSIVYLPANVPLNLEPTTTLLSTEQGRLTIRDFLIQADISIADVQAIPRKGFMQQVVFGASGVAHTSREESEFLVPQFLHTTSRGSASFELTDESQGTQRLYGLIAPVLDILKSGRILVVDELDSSLHTLLVRRLIQMFHDPKLNTANAQLIFSTHDTSLLDRTLFRRDQIWFTEKDASQATKLYPLTDFGPRKQEAWERGYLMGRYGAVPFFSQNPIN